MHTSKHHYLVFSQSTQIKHINMAQILRINIYEAVSYEKQVYFLTLGVF